MADTLGLFDPARAADLESARKVQGVASGPAQPIALPVTLHPPAGARPWLVQLFGTAAGVVRPDPAPSLSALVENWGAEAGARWTRLPGTGDFFADSGQTFTNSPGQIRWFAGDTVWTRNDPLDASTSLLRVVVTRLGETYGDAGDGSVFMLEDRTNNVRLRFTVRRGAVAGVQLGNSPPRFNAYLLTVTVGRSEGAQAEIARLVVQDRTPGGEPAYTADARALRFGLNADGTLRLELLRTPEGQAEVWGGLASVVLPDPWPDVFEPGRVFLSVGNVNAGQNGGGLGAFTGSRPVGAVAAPADLPVQTYRLRAPVGNPGGRPDGFRVQPAQRAVLETVRVSLLVLDGPASVPPHNVADVWVRLALDGAPLPGLAEIRPAALLSGPAPVQAGRVFERELRPRMALRAGALLTAELFVRDSTAGHPVAVELSGWLWEGA